MKIKNKEEFMEMCKKLGTDELHKTPWFIAAILPDGELVSSSSLPMQRQVQFLEHLAESTKKGGTWNSAEAHPVPGGTKIDEI